MIMLMCCTQYVSKFGKLSRTGKGQFSFQFQRTMPKNVPTTMQLHSLHMLGYAQYPSSHASAVHEPRATRCISLVQKGRGTTDPIANICWIMEKATEFQKNISFCFIDYTKALCGNTTNCKTLNKDGTIGPHYLSTEKPVCSSRSNSQYQAWSNELVQNQERSTTRLYTVTLLM